MTTKLTKESITALSTLLTRIGYGTGLGYQYGTDRDLYEVLGYPLVITPTEYAAKYERMDIAKAIINRPVEATWRGGVRLSDGKDEEETEFERAWLTMDSDLGLVSRFARLDKLAGLGEYGVMLLGFDDVADLPDWVNPVQGGRKLLYVKPLTQSHAQIDLWETDVSSERYGLPLVYNVSMTTPGTQESTITLRAHWTRCIHVADGLTESEVHGTPRLKAVWNRLMDLEKIVGGSGEMFWRNARPGYAGKLDPEFSMSTADQADLQDQADEFNHNLQRILITKGVELKAMTQPVADPTASVDVQIQMISAETGIPKRILTGSERGELASSEDRNNWFDLIQGRREEFAGPVMVRPFVERMIEFDALPDGGSEWTVEWEDLYAPSDKQKAEVGKVRTEAMSKYVSSGVEALIQPDQFLELVIGMDKKQVEEIKVEREQWEKEEEAQALEDQKVIDEENARLALEQPAVEGVPAVPAPPSPTGGPPIQ